MPDYLELEKLYYKKQDIESEYNNRINNPCAFKTGLFINPIYRGERKKDNELELFYLPIQEILFLQDKITENSKRIVAISDTLPEIAKKNCIDEIMINEIVKSNQVEGVYTTKKDVYDSMISKNVDRLTGIINKYVQIKETKINKIHRVEEIRNMYDDIFGEDILQNPNNKLDGELFRKGMVHISDGFRNVHTGDIEEKSIISHLKNLINFMNNDDINFLIKTSITHYYFEYIHPFYDGNGRFGRLLCSMYLARKLDIFTGLSLSYAVFLETAKYSKLFSNTSNDKNYGEITFFIKGFLEIIITGQNSIEEMLKEKTEKFKYTIELIENLPLDKLEKETLFIYIQYYIFSKTTILKDKDLLKLLDISRPTLNNILKSLEDNDYIIKVSKNPSIHSLGDNIKI